MFKPDTPRSIPNRKGKLRLAKYEQPRGSRLMLDVPPICLAHIGNPVVDNFIVEGIKKADCLASKGRCAITLTGGVWGWLGTNEHGGKTALPDWREVALNGCRVFICFDSDAATKPEISQAQRELAAYLTSRGAKVFVITVPEMRPTTV